MQFHTNSTQVFYPVNEESQVGLPRPEGLKMIKALTTQIEQTPKYGETYGLDYGPTDNLIQETGWDGNLL